MENRSLGTTLVLWLETIISARILMFTVPVLISKKIDHILWSADINNWFIVVVTTACLIFLLIGIASLLNFSMWRVFHYIGTLIVLVLTASIFSRCNAAQLPFEGIYALPAAFAIVFTILISILGKSNTASLKKA